MKVENYKNCIVVDGLIAIDGNPQDSKIRLRIQSHHHEDHGAEIGEFKRSLSWFKKIYMTNACRELMTAKNSDLKRLFGSRKVQIQAMKYNEEMKYRIGDKEYTIVLYNNMHVLGSCQIFIKNNSDNETFLYSSDIGPDIKEFPKATHLLIDGTCGKKTDAKRTEESMLNEFMENISKLIMEKKYPIHIIGHVGTIEKVISKIQSIYTGFDFYCGDEIYNQLGVYTQYNYSIDIESVINQKSAPIDNDKYFYFSATEDNASKVFHNFDCFNILLTGFHSEENNGWVLRKNENGNLRSAKAHITQHANYSKTLEYIKRVRPDHLYIDSIRKSEKGCQFLINELSNERELDRMSIKSLMIDCD